MLNLISVLTIAISGETLAFLRPETRFLSPVMYPQYLPASRSVTPQGYMKPEQVQIPDIVVPQDHIQPILHTRTASPSQPLQEPVPPIDFNFIFDDESELQDVQSRAAKSGYEYQTHAPSSAPYPQTPSYGYTPPAPGYNPAPASAASYSPPARSPQPPSTKISILKPDLLSSLLKPVTTKVATKVSGLIGLVLSLLTGSVPDDLELNGFKEIVINGIVKPLLLAKGGLKTLISKLTIPLISLLLINLEVLVTVWWLWEECPASEVKPTYGYDKPPITNHGYSTNYNSYQ